jgi:hypothetical protein
VTAFQNKDKSWGQITSVRKRSTNQGFESGSFRYHCSESFKLEILNSVMQVSAPDEFGEAANTAATAIDTVSDD